MHLFLSQVIKLTRRTNGPQIGHFILHLGHKILVTFILTITLLMLTALDNSLTRAFSSEVQIKMK